jgi:NTP pyrophosphatase (non-canonical NTP hydrolase)
MINEVLEYAKKAPPRYIGHVFLQLAEEAGELATEIKIANGFTIDKVEGADGIVGEAIDVIQCAIDIIYLYNPSITEEQLNVIMKKKLEKWSKKWEL